MPTSFWKHFLRPSPNEEVLIGVIGAEVESVFPVAFKKANDRPSSPAFELLFLFDKSEGEWVGPWKSRSFASPRDITDYPSGCKVVFRQEGRIPNAGKLAMYSHMGIIMSNTSSRCRS